MLEEILEGKPIAHPLHPLLVHFPVALFVLSLVMDIGAYTVRDGTWLYHGAFYAMALGIIMALVAAVPGLVDWMSIRSDHPAKRTATWHMVLNLLVVILYAINLGVRWPRLDAGTAPALPLALSVTAVVILGLSGYLGAVMIYDDGIAVGRQRRRTRLPGETIRVSGEPGQYVAVAPIERCADHESLRAEVNGNVMAIVNVDGQFYALQEFCTHRYGPLSEGDYHSKPGQVVCPWHASCFDLRSGTVTQGPAKIGARTYDVQVRDGQIWVRAD